MLDAVGGYSETVERGPEGAADALAHPIATSVESFVTVEPGGVEVRRNLTRDVLRLRLMDSETRLPGPLLTKGVDFEVTMDGRIGWRLGDRRGTAPAPAEPRNALLDAIKGGAKLRHVAAPEPKGPLSAKGGGGGGNDLASTLASALAKRHKAQESDSDSDSDWDDD